MTTSAILERLARRERERLVAQVRQQREQLRARFAEAAQQEAEMSQTLALLHRNMDAMCGGLQELEQLLAALDSPPNAS